MSQEYIQDGWQNNQQDNILINNQISSIRYRGQKGLSILQSKTHSLQPDMISGWKPKLPSCPLPITYINIYVDSLIKHLHTNTHTQSQINKDKDIDKDKGKDQLYSIVYLGTRYINSVQINQQYKYYWKYRDRYSLNLAIVQDAIKKIGNQTYINNNNNNNIQSSSVQIKKCIYKFDSCFQSGNLDLVVRVRKNQYDCFIRSDTNTKGHTNWYYFKIQNNNQIGPIKINICNMTKYRNLYSKGMKPYTRLGQQGTWTQQQCYDVNFVQRYCRYGFDKKTNQLQFWYNFTSTNQCVYFAYSIPYTFTQLQKFIKQIKYQYPKLVHNKRLCQSLGGIQVPLLTITNQEDNTAEQQIQNSPINQSQTMYKHNINRNRNINGNGNNNINGNNGNTSSQQKHQKHQKQQKQINSNPTQIKKKVIIIAARIHPGQSNSSYMIQGFIRQLLKDTQSSNILRNMFIFYIVPMINPDGVIAGNFRTSYSGKDLNRQFNKLNKYIFPEITALCELGQSIKKSSLRGIQFYFDFHGHSAKKNLFCYGPQHPTTKIHYFKARALAKIIQKISPIFSYRKSIFTINQQKKNTGRSYMLKNLKIPMTFTFQISNGLYQNENKKDILLNKSILLHTGQIILKGLYRYAQLEMKIPKKYIKAKVDTGNIKNRHLNSAGASRRGDTLKKKVSQESADACRIPKGKNVDKSISLDKIKTQDNKQFLALIKQIKKDQEEFKDQQVQIQGGSDSQSDQDDFNKEQTQQLFDQILKRNNNYGYVIREKKKNKTLKLNYKKKQNQQDDLENSIRGPILVQKKFRSTRMIEMSRPPIASIKNIKRGISVQYQKVVLAQKNFTILL